MTSVWSGLAVSLSLPAYFRSEFYGAVILLETVLAMYWFYGIGPGLLCNVISSMALCLFLYRHGMGYLSILQSVGFSTISALGGRWFADRRAEMFRVVTENNELTKMVNMAPVGLALMSVERKLVRSNPALRRMFGLSEDQCGDGYLPLPESKRAEWEQLVDQLRRGEPYLNVETLRKRSDGAAFYAHISANPLVDKSGPPDKLVGVIADTTVMHRRYLERYVLESLVHRSIDFICVADLQQNIIFINDVGRQLIGISEDDISPALPFAKLFVGTNDQWFQSTIVPRLVAGDCDLQLRLQLRHFGSEGPVSALCNLFSVHDPISNEPACVACVAHLARSSFPDARFYNGFPPILGIKPSLRQ